MTSSVTIVSGGAPSPKGWSTGLCDICVDPGVFAYAFFCAPCAAGEIAQAAGRDYCVSCCVFPMLGGPVAVCCWTCGDRQAVIQRYNINDTLGSCGACAVASFVPCGLACVLTQELNHVRNGANKGGQTTSVVVVNNQPQGAPQYSVAPPMYAQPPPQQYAQPPPQYASPPPQYGAPPLPPGWSAVQDASGRTYYANAMTGQTSWTVPAY